MIKTKDALLYYLAQFPNPQFQSHRNSTARSVTRDDIASLISRPAPGRSSIDPIRISISSRLVSYKTRVLPHSPQKPLKIPGVAWNVLYVLGDISYGFKSASVSHLNCLRGRETAVITIASLCFLHWVPPCEICHYGLTVTMNRVVKTADFTTRYLISLNRLERHIYKYRRRDNLP